MNNDWQIPKIDLEPLRTDPVNGFHIVAEQIRKIYTTIGFAYLVNHGISKALIDGVFNAAAQFHALPAEEKLKIRQNRFFRGYMPFNGSQFEQSTLEKATIPNQSEAFIIAHEVSEQSADYQLGQNLAGPNQWPDSLANFKQVVTAYYDAMLDLAQKMVQVFSLAFGMTQSDLNAFFHTPTVFLRLQFYPEQPAIIPDQQYGIAPHTDYGFLTLLAQNGIGGLQVKNNAGEWIDVPPIKNAFILNSGDMIKWMTNDRFISTPHRVINTSGKKRFAIPFFFEPNMHAQIAPLDIFTSANEPAKYPQIEYCEHLMKTIRSNYKDIGA
ncbi:isopenicillin N synthase family dioxygenase [Serratia fonticola]|uniref:isopenicillin N synthase family dioxygenase n=1 Tax=Serratia fonticola TaxID=47917 RepID=UPI003BB7B52A